ncbi:MAG TPA: C39 family peptidase [Candidatus Kapabacteria bacterium]|nr:C39 family peptidase [Candidatus Kapabacteria bacterium]
MRHMKSLILVFLGIHLLFPGMTLAADKLPLGANCNSDSDCLSDSCQDSDLDVTNDNYCACNEDNDCSVRYGQEPNETWSCNGDNDASHDLDFCVSTVRGSIYPLSIPTSPSLSDRIFDPESSATFDEIGKLLEQPQPRIRIPGVSFTDPAALQARVHEGEDGNTYLSIPYLGEYIAAIYRYLVVIAGLVAVILIIIAGFQLITSGGNSEAVEGAKTRITHAVSGLLLAVGSYALLYTINPNLVEFKDLRVLYVKGKSVDAVLDLTQDLTPEELEQQIGSGTVNGMPYFSQRGNTTPFGACGTIESSGCGPTSLAMVLKHFGHVVTPESITKEWAELGYRECPTPPPTNNICSGCANLGHTAMFEDQQILNKYKIKTTYLHKDQKKILDSLRAGKPVIASMGPSVFTSGGHFVVLAKLNADGTIGINDPNKISYCDTGETKCTPDHRTIPMTAVPQSIVFGALKYATSFEKKL